MKYVKIEMTVKPELATRIMDLVKADVVTMTMTMMDDAKPAKRRNITRHHAPKGTLPASIACGLKLMQQQNLDFVWTSSQLGDAMMRAEGYSRTSGSATMSALIKAGLAERGDGGVVRLTDAGRAWA